MELGKNSLLLLSCAVLILSVSVGMENSESTSTPPQEDQKTQKAERMIGLIKATQDTKIGSNLYRELFNFVGPEEAQERLYRSGLPFDGESHLLNHTAGDWLYEKYGLGGLVYCKDYFLSSCYHGFVLHSVANGGLDALTEVMDTCWDKGYHVAIQCAHAIGHGFLTWVGYKDLPKALSTCDEFGKKSENFPLYNCYDGAFMENVWAVHEDGKPSEDRWVKESDDFYPCNDPRIPHKYITACWSNQPSLLYLKWGEDFTRIGNICQKVTDTVHQKTCFDGLARQIHSLTHGSLEKTFRLCGYMPSEKWWSACINSVSKSTFGIGDRELPFQICNALENENQEYSCFKELFTVISAYTTKEEKKDFCKKIENPQRSKECAVSF